MKDRIELIQGKSEVTRPHEEQAIEELKKRGLYEATERLYNNIKDIAVKSVPKEQSIFTSRNETDYERRELEAIRRLKLEGRIDEANEMFKALQERLNIKVELWEKR